MKRIALIGSAPSSVARAPYDDPSWTIFACSPGAIARCKRIDAFFELHPFIEGNPCYEPGYIKRLAALKCPVYVVQPVPEIPTSTPYPKEEVLGYSWGTIRNVAGLEYKARFDPNSFTSSLSWMLAFAIAQQPDEIGLWGVDMAADEEVYSEQKAGCLSLIHVAKSIGIRITIPPESDLLRPHPLYGFQEFDHFWIKSQKRDEEILARINDCAAVLRAKEQEYQFLLGARANNAYVMRTWIADPQAMHMMFTNPPLLNEPPPEPVAPVKRPRGRPRKVAFPVPTSSVLAVPEVTASSA